MIKKIKQWWKYRGLRKDPMAISLRDVEPEVYDREQMEQVYRIGYNDGKRDGLSIARQQATKSLKEILSWQNENQPSRKK